MAPVFHRHLNARISLIIWSLNIYQGIMVVMRSCCCCSPRTGCLFIAVLYMFFTGLLLLGLGILLAYFEFDLKPIIVDFIMYNYLPVEDVSSLDVSTEATRNVIIASIILNCLYFSVCLLLFVGGVKECWRYLIPWIFAEFIRHLLFIAAFVFLAWCCSVLVNKRRIDYGTLLLFWIIMLVVNATTFYFWLAIIAAFQEYRSKEKQVSPEEGKDSFPLSDISLMND